MLVLAVRHQGAHAAEHAQRVLATVQLIRGVVLVERLRQATISLAELAGLSLHLCGERVPRALRLSERHMVVLGLEFQLVRQLRVPSLFGCQVLLGHADHDVVAETLERRVGPIPLEVVQAGEVSQRLDLGSALFGGLLGVTGTLSLGDQRIEVSVDVVHHRGLHSLQVVVPVLEHSLDQLLRCGRQALEALLHRRVNDSVSVVGGLVAPLLVGRRVLQELVGAHRPHALLVLGDGSVHVQHLLDLALGSRLGHLGTAHQVHVLGHSRHDLRCHARQVVRHRHPQLALGDSLLEHIAHDCLRLARGGGHVGSDRELGCGLRQLSH